MSLNKFNEEYIIKRLKRTKIDCPICRNNNFQLVNGFTRREIFQSQDIPNAFSNVPSVTLVCRNCRYTLDFNTSILNEDE